MAKLEMEIINTHCAGIDIGSRSHFVAVGQSIQDVKEFGVYAEDLTAICVHLTSHNINSVAMESTGNYWQNLYVELVRMALMLRYAMASLQKTLKGKNRCKGCQVDTKTAQHRIAHRKFLT